MAEWPHGFSAAETEQITTATAAEVYRLAPDS